MHTSLFYPLTTSISIYRNCKDLPLHSKMYSFFFFRIPFCFSFWYSLCYKKTDTNLLRKDLDTSQRCLKIKSIHWVRKALIYISFIASRQDESYEVRISYELKNLTCNFKHFSWNKDETWTVGNITWTVDSNRKFYVL